jgi:WD40 repeat protein
VSRLRLSGQGNDGQNGEAPGDVYVRLLKVNEKQVNKDKGIKAELDTTEEAIASNICIFPAACLADVFPAVLGDDGSTGILLARITDFYDDLSSIMLVSTKDGSFNENLLTGHTANITSIMFNSNGKILASGSRDGTIRVWDIETEKSQLILDNQSEVTTLAFSPTRDVIASGDTNGSVKQWSIKTGKILTQSKHKDLVTKVSFSPDGKFLASASRDGNFIIQDATSLLPIQKLIIPGMISSVAFSQNGRYLASGTVERGIFKEYGIITVRRLKEDYSRSWVVGTFKDSSGIASLNFDLSGKYLVSANVNEVFKMWDIDSNQQITSRECKAFCIVDFNLNQLGIYTLEEIFGS